MKYRRYLRSVIFLSVLSISFGQVLYAQYPSKIPSGVSHLKFDVIAGKDSLYTAKDQHGNTWIKGYIPSAMDDGMQLVFRIPSSQHTDYIFYADQGKGFVQLVPNINIVGQKIQSRYPLYFFQSAAREYYLNLKHVPVRGIDVEVSRPTAFLHQETVALILNNLYYGLSLMAIVFNIVLYRIFKDRRFILYSMLQLSLLLIFFYEDGMFYFLSRGVFYMKHYLVWNIAVCATLAGLFAYHFLDLKNNMPHFRRWARPFIAGIFGSVLLYTLTEILFFRYLASVFFYLFPGICLYQAIRMFRKDVYARFLLVPFGVIILISAFYTFHKYFEWPLLSFFDMHVVRLTHIMGIVGISFILVYKVKTIQDENEMYRESLDSHLHVLETLKKAHTELLKNGNGNEANHPRQEIIAELRSQYDLTERELEVLRCIQERWSNQEIAEKLCISLSTTKYHVGNLYFKLDVKNRKEAQQVIQQL